MASTFVGLSIAKRGLSASQTGLSVTTNNMSNIDTTGYSRQVLNQTEIGPAAVYSNSQVGGGSEVTSVDSVRSFRLDQKYWQETSSAGSWNAKSTYLQQAEETIGSTDSSYISTALDKFSSELETLSTDASDTSVRKSVIEYAQNLCSTLNDTASDLTQLRSDVNEEVSTSVQQINSYSKQIAVINEKISLASASGASTNELEDQMGVLVDKLSSLVDVQATQNDNGTLEICVNGSTLVSGNQARQLECYTVTDQSSSQYGMYGIRWADNQSDFDAGDSGSLSGYLAVRDGDSADNKGISYYMDQLDSFAQTLAQTFNEGTGSYSGHLDGYGLDGTTGTYFFSYSDNSSSTLASQKTASTDTDTFYKKYFTAANISISSDLSADSSKLAAASSSSGATDDTTNLSDLISICEDADVDGTSTLSGMYGTIVSSIGTDSEYAQTQYSRKSAFSTYINTSRASVSGVSSDEETVNLTTYQSAYAASASMVSNWNKIYQTTLDMVDD